MESQNAMPVVKGKVGRSKVVKVKNETMPTPQGRRIIPRITSTMKVQAVKKEGAKRGKAVKVCMWRMSLACMHKRRTCKSLNGHCTALQVNFSLVYSDCWFYSCKFNQFH